jgi:hypothetical protein
VAGQIEYVLPGSLLYGMRLAVSGLPLHSTGKYDLDYGRPNWRQETTISGGSVPTRPTIWAPISLNLIVIWPADAVGGLTLTCDGIANTPFLTTPNATVDLDEAGLGLLLDYALHAVSFIEGSDRFQTTDALYRGFLTGCAERNQALAASSWYRRYMGLDRQKDFRPTKSRGMALEGVVGGQG